MLCDLRVKLKLILVVLKASTDVVRYLMSCSWHLAGVTGNSHWY